MPEFNIGGFHFIDIGCVLMDSLINGFFFEGDKNNINIKQNKVNNYNLKMMVFH